MRRQAVLILGMHRSGTSALARMLNLLGCDLPRTLMPGAEGNPNGHWESSMIMAFNESILQSGGSSWDDWLEFNPEWYKSPVAGDFSERGATVLREEYGTSPLFVLKDPRNCRLTLFWLDVLSKDGIEPLVVVPLRNPIEVAASLEARNDMHPSLAMLLWLRHVLDAEYGSRGQRRFFLSYEDLLGNWSGLAEQMQTSFGIKWPRFSIQTGIDVDGFLDHGERHHVRSKQSVSSNALVSQWIHNIYKIISKWVDTGEDPSDFAALDDIRQQFNVAGPAFAKLSHAISAERKNSAELRDLLEEKQDEISKMTERLSTIDRLHDDNARHKDYVEQLERQLLNVQDSAESEKRAREDAYARLHIVLAEKESDSTAINDDREHFDKIVHDLNEQIISINDERNDYSEKLANIQNDLDRSANDISDRDHQIGNLQSTLRQREEEIFQTIAALDAERTYSSDTKIKYNETLLQCDIFETKLKTANEWVFRLAGERQAANSQLALSEQKNLSLERKLESLKLRLVDLEKRQKYLVSERSALLSRLEADTSEREMLIQTLTYVEEQSAKHKEDLAAAQDRLDDQKQEAASFSAHSQAKIAALETTLRHQERHERELLSLVESLRIQAKDAERRSAASQAEAASFDTASKLRDAELLRLRKSGEQAHGKIEEQSQKIALLSDMLQNTNRDTERNEQQIDWLRRVNDVLTIYPRWWALMPKQWRLKKIRKRLLRKGLFDTDAYLSRYPDVSSSTIEPVRHYIIHGMKENREI